MRFVRLNVVFNSQSSTIRSYLNWSVPVGIPESYQEHVELMFDLMALAYQVDMTRVFTFMLGRELNGRAYPEIGIPDSHHGVSHHRDDPDRLAQMARDQHIPRVSVSDTFLMSWRIRQMGMGRSLIIRYSCMARR